jgi:tRNA pseudouridine55 synthase
MKGGIININKPSGLTSSDVVSRLRKNLGGKRKVGHAGTLDPNARGVLLILVDDATKVSNYFMHQEKEYETLIVLGVATDTHDGEGRVLSNSDCRITREQFEAALKKFTGRQKQVPPMLSAKKHKGEKLYELFRRGVTVTRKPEDIEIKSIKLLSYDYPKASFRLVCSKGTYVRTLCNDIGEFLGCGAYMDSLIRTRVGKFVLKDSVSEIENTGCDKYIKSLENLLAEYPCIIINEESARGIKNGKQIEPADVVNICNINEEFKEKEPCNIFPVFDENRNLLAMAHAMNKNGSAGEITFKLLRVLS